MFAPELTPRARVNDFKRQRDVLMALDLRVESDFFPVGRRNQLLAYGYAGNVGPDGNNARLEVDQFRFDDFPPSGLYPFRILKGREESSDSTSTGALLPEEIARCTGLNEPRHIDAASGRPRELLIGFQVVLNRGRV